MKHSYVIGLVVLVMAASVGITLWATSIKPPGNRPKVESSPCPTPDTTNLTQRINDLTDRLSTQAALVAQTIEQEKLSVETAINNFIPTLTQHRNEMKINERTSLRDTAERNLRESERTMAKLEGKREVLAILNPKVIAVLAAPEPSPSGSADGAK